MIRTLALVVAVVIGAAVALAVAGRLRAAGPNATGLLYLLDLGVLALATGAALVQVGGRRYRPQGTLVVGLYALPIGAAFLCCAALWALVPGSLDVRSDNAILGAIFLGALIILAGVAIAVASTIVILRGPAGPARFLALLVGLLVAVGATVALALGPSAVVFVLSLAGIGILLVARREWATVRLPLAVAVGGAAVLIALLVARGPEDWATAGQSVKLFGFPVLVAGVVIGFGIFELARIDRRGAGEQGA